MVQQQALTDSSRKQEPLERLDIQSVLRSLISAHTTLSPRQLGDHASVTDTLHCTW